MGMGSGKGKAPKMDKGLARAVKESKQQAAGAKADAVKAKANAMAAAKSKKQTAAAGPSGAPKPGMGMGEKMKAKLDKQERKMPYKPGEGGRGLPPKPTSGMAPQGAGPSMGDIAAKAKAPKKLVSLPKPAAPAPAMKKGGMCKKYARGGGIEVRGKTKGKFI
jgi:hypothetical protein